MIDDVIDAMIDGACLRLAKYTKYDENGNVTEIDASELCRFIALIYRVWVDAKTYTWIKNSFEKRGIRLT